MSVSQTIASYSFTCVLFTVSMMTSGVQATETIAFRLPAGHTMHFNEPSLAEQHLAAVRKLGCEANKDQHEGHIDVSYRTVNWKSLDLTSPALTQQWEAWLKGAGFETLRGHAADHSIGSDSRNSHAGHDHASHGHEHGAGQLEQVAYRLPRWSTQHFTDREQFDEFVSLMKAFGCEVRTDSHEDHVDVSFRCPNWNHVDFPSHEIAQTWETWLSKSGFEVQHQH